MTDTAYRRFLLSALCFVAAAEGASLPFDGLNDLRGPYDGTGTDGGVLYVCRIGEAGGLPISAYWSSTRQERSPIFGYGWCVPALESKFVKLDDRRWVFHQPDGFARVFVPVSRGNATSLTGGPAWSATVKSADTIRVTADPNDGGPKSEFTFQQGRLTRMICEEGDFDIKYAGRVPERITSRGRTILEILRKTDEDGQTSVTIRFNGGKSQATAVCKTVTAFSMPDPSSPAEPISEKCLAYLTAADGQTVSFDYGGTIEEATFKANGDTWKWNPRTRKITAHGEWLYMVSEPKNEWDEPAITRGHPDGRKERYSYDRKNGLREQVLPDGTKRECKMFTSGPLAWRRARWVRDTTPDGNSVTTKFYYNEAGRVVYQRTTRNGDASSTEELWFDDAGKPFRRRLNEEEVPVE